MAQITLGIGMSHSPRLVSRPEDWIHFGSFARSMGGFLDIDGNYIPGNEVIAKYSGQYAEQATLAVWQAEYKKARAALAQLVDAVKFHRIDTLIVLGDDQHELLRLDNYPAILVHYGPEFKMVDSAAKAKRRGAGPLPDFLLDQIARGWHMDKDHLYPNRPDLAQNIIAELIADGMTPAVASENDPNPAFGMGHAIGIAISELLGYTPGQPATVPIVPILLNTYFPPNQPTPEICWRIGQALKRAVGSLPDDSRVAVVASGGLSHFIVNEEWDQEMLALLRAGDPTKLQAIPMKMLQSGNSEMLNWIATASACGHLTVKWDSYAPIYSQSHREGVGLAFMEWS